MEKRYTIRMSEYVKFWLRIQVLEFKDSKLKLKIKKINFLWNILILVCQK